MWVIGYGLLLFAGTAIWGIHWLIAPMPGSVEEALLQVRVGMNREEAAAALQSYDQDVIESVWCSGHTKDGHEFFKSWFYKFEYCVLDSLEFEDCELMAMDYRGNEAYVYLDRTGMVTGTRYAQIDTPGEKLHMKVRRALDHKAVHRVIGQKLCRALGL